MANPSHTLIANTGTFTVWPDFFRTPFNLSYEVALASGTSATFTLHYTLNNPNALPGSVEYGWTPIWLPNPTNGTSQTGSVGGFYTSPIRGLQLIVSAISGGKMLWEVLQGMSSR